MSLIAISSLLLGITIAHLNIQAQNKPEPAPPKKQQLSVEDIQGIVVVYAGEKPD
jgi:hypothetical protein